MALTAIVDLSTNAVVYHDTNPTLRARFLGGRGIGAKMLFDRVGVNVAPFDPANCLVFTTGLFSGTPFPTASRYHVTFKSPATNAYGYANAGGHIGPELARAGFDAIVVTGQARAPVYLQVTDRAIAIRSADHLWGQTTSATHDALLGAGGRVLCIGLAGENLVRIAAIINDYGRAAARGGPGAVMGSKRLKAIHVRADVRAHTPPQFAEIARRTAKHLIDDPKNAGLIADGTPFLLRPKNLSGDLPAKNHQLGQVPFIDAMDAQALRRYRVKRMGCAMCPIRCSRLSVAEGIEVEGPEYETTDALGPMCWNGKPEVIIRANALCNEFGLDTISTGVTIAFAMECHAHGLLSDPDLSLEWGDARSILGLVVKIARREGIGDVLAEGTRRAAQVIGRGADAYAMQVKGLELPRQEPRFAKGFGLGHATSNRGADHLYALPAIDLGGNWDTARKIFPSEIVAELMDPANEKYKADMVIYGEHYSAVTDSLGICKFSTIEEYSLLPDDIAAGLNALGIETTGAALLEIGERIVNLERLYNVREGFARADDYLPRRFTAEPLELRASETDALTGKTRLGNVIRIGRIDDFDTMLDRYYRLRGWDSAGRPTAATLARLGLISNL
jgi:aldehyde:ferredoxin oxidoreductase